MSEIKFTDDEFKLLDKLIDDRIKLSITRLAQIQRFIELDDQAGKTPDESTTRFREASRLRQENIIQICWNTLEKIERLSDK